MLPLFKVNGLIFWSAKEIAYREWIGRFFASEIQGALKLMNKAWEFHQIEAPILTPVHLINPEYNPADYYAHPQDNLALRPETTIGSYEYARYLLNHQHRLPICIWQIGKSFRREQDQVTKNMRLKEFYQQEFQCIYTEGTKADYHSLILPLLQIAFKEATGIESTITDSDRLPAYSLKTTDFLMNGMEICSVSTRTDFGDKMFVLEIAIGLDRCIYQWSQLN